MATPQAAPESWQDVGGGTLVKWDEARTIEGRYQGSVEVTGKYGKQAKHTLLTEDDKVLEFYAPAILQRKLEDPRITKGTLIRIIYDGTSEATGTGRMAKSFVVQIAGGA